MQDDGVRVGECGSASRRPGRMQVLRRGDDPQRRSGAPIWRTRSLAQPGGAMIEWAPGPAGVGGTV